MDLKNYIRDVANYPVKGVTFKDITPVLLDKKAFKYSIEQLKKIVKDWDIDLIVGPESRGFIFGCPLAYTLGVGFVPTRKPKKLPSDYITDFYDTEYSKGSLSIHIDAIKKGQKILLVDDLLATGGTIRSSANLVKRLGGEVVGAVFLIEIKKLQGYKKMNGIKYHSLIVYD